MSDLSFQIKEKVLALDNALKTVHPQMPTLLREIWQSIKANPEQATLLEESEIAVIVSGLKKQTATEIATAALKTRSKAVKNLTLADL
jgi:valyl-tRNA synthetase